MRLAAYTDYTYHRLDGQVYADRAFALFLAGLASRFERFVILGRLDGKPALARYPLGEAEFVGLPFYETLSEPLTAIRAMPGALRRFWQTLDGVDAVWLFGPHPIAIPFVVLAKLRRKRVVLGIRQDLPAMIASRHARRPLLRAAAFLLEGSFRVITRFIPVIVVGPHIAERYGHASALLEIAVSLVTEDDLVAPQEAAGRRYEQPLTLLSVGRLDPEKNPLLLADTLALLRERGGDWRLQVCGEGPMRDALAERLEALGLSDYTELEGYVPLRPDLLARYRQSHALLHISWTEGLPQVLVEAAASALPIVATDVGGIREALGEGAVLIPPGDAVAAADAVEAITRDPELRGRTLDAAHEFAREHVLDTELDRVADFIAEGDTKAPIRTVPGHADAVQGRDRRSARTRFAAPRRLG